MALDGIYLSLLKKEFETLIGARVDKIHQPSREELLIGLRTREGGKKLLINAGSGSARIHLTTQEIENPKTPPMLCMLLRKHLSSGRLIDIRQDGFERILFLDFESTDELGDRADLTLVVEIMGRCSNVILVSGEGRIIDSIHRVNPDGSARPVLPGMKYEAPPREQRLNIFDAPREELEHKLKEFPKAELSKTLLKVCEGISPIFARECADIALHGGDAPIEDMKSDDFDRLACYIKSIGEQIENGVMNRKDKGRRVQGFLLLRCNAVRLAYGYQKLWLAKRAARSFLPAQGYVRARKAKSIGSFQAGEQSYRAHKAAC